MKDTGAIIVAAGSGARFGGKVPKQFLALCGKPVFYWSIKAFQKAGVRDIVVVVPQLYLPKLTKQEKTPGVRFVAGGKERYHSVQNGLSALPKNVKIVAIHDGARPLIRPSVIKSSIVSAAKSGAALVAVLSKDTVKLSKNGARVDATTPRASVWLAQTPQAFKRSIIEKAYRAINPAGITDDAQAAELAGYRVSIVQGSYNNLKITHPLDLKLAEILMKEKD